MNIAEPYRPNTLRHWLRRLEPAFYITPAFLVLFIILVYPLGYSFWLSFHEWTLRGFRQGVPFVGLANYISLFQNGDFLNSLRITFTFVILAIAAEFSLGMGLALLLNRDLKGKGLIRSGILLPMMCTNVVIGLTWRLLFNYEFGIINYYLTQVGLKPVEWLSNPTIAMGSVIIVDVWNTTSFVALMLLAGLQSLPEEPFEAAKMDGASGWQTFRFLTLPLLRQTILVALLWRLIDTFRIFDVIYLLTAGRAARATETVSIYIYRYGFQSFNLGYASAASYAMILIMLLIAGVLARLIGRSGNRETAMTRYRFLKILSRVVIYTTVIIAVILSLAPIVYLLITSFKQPELTFAVPPVWIFTPTLKNYTDVFAGGTFTHYFMNSLVIALVTTFVAVALGAFAAYGFARFRFRGAFWLRMSVLIPQMLPPITIIVPLYVLFNGLKLTDTRTALIISYLTFTIPLAIWMMVGFFEDVPAELEESAMIDGCNRLGALVRVSLPIVAPGLAATAILGFLYSWNEFLYAVILTGRDARTLPVTITSFMTNKAILWGRIAASGSLVLIPVLIFALIAQRYLIRGLSRGQ